MPAPPISGHPVKPGGRLPRYTAIVRTAIRRKPRKPSVFARIFGSKQRVQWVKQLPCVGCGVVGWSDNAHVCGNGGTSRKADYDTIAPLCRSRVGVVGCHPKYDEWEPPFDSPDVRSLVVLAARRTAEAWVARVERA